MNFISKSFQYQFGFLLRPFISLVYNNNSGCSYWGSLFCYLSWFLVSCPIIANYYSTFHLQTIIIIPCTHRVSRSSLLQRPLTTRMPLVIHLKEPDKDQTVEELVQFIMVRVTGKQSFTTTTTPPQASNSAIDDVMTYKMCNILYSSNSYF